MTADRICYRYHVKTGMELVYCEHSSIAYPLHNHVSVLTIGIVLDGCVVLTTNEGARACEGGQVFVLYPYVPHQIATPKNYTLLSICINKNALMRYDRDTFGAHIAAFLPHVLDTQRIAPQKIMRLLNAQNIYTACRNWHEKEQSALIGSLKRQLERAPEQKQTIEEMAQKAFLSKYHFIRKFQEEVGLTPHQFQMQNRIRKAKRLMHQNKTLTEVALSAGFCDQSHFIRQFEKQVGLSPLTYKHSVAAVGLDKAD